MKKLLKNSLFWVSIVFAGANAYNPSLEVEDNWESKYSTKLSDQRVNNPVIDDDIEEYGEDDNNYRKTWEENRKGKVREAETWFVDVDFLGCSTPNDYVCPPLKDEFLSSGYRSRINYIDLKNGKISCSVLPPLDKNQFLTTRSETALYTNVYVNKGCVEKYSTATNLDTSEAVQNLKKENEEFNESLKQQEYKYTVDYKKSGDDEFLDLADILDAIVTFNPNVFDLENTLLTRDLKTMPGYTTLPNETIVTKLEQQFKSFGDMWNGSGFNNDRFFEEVDKQASIRDLSNDLSNSSFLMLLDYFIKSNDLIVILSQGLAFIFILYNGIITWALPSLTLKISKKENWENSPQRAIIGIGALLILFAGDVERYDIEYESKTEDTVKTELILQQTNIQTIIQFLSSETNYYADMFAEIGIKSFLNTLNLQTGILKSEQIEALATERMILTKEKEALVRIEKDMCYANYDVHLIKNKLSDYRSETIQKMNKADTTVNLIGLKIPTTVSVSELKQNPFPKSEREANAMMRHSKDRKYINTSPYNPAWNQNNSGVVEYTERDKFRTGYYSPLSLSGCYNNNKKMVANDQRLREIEKEFQRFESAGQKAAKVELLRAINEIQWSLFAKQGYLSIIYLPVTHLLLENLGIIEDINTIYEKSKANDEDAITDFTTSSIQTIAEDIPILFTFGGYQIAKMLHVIKEPLIDFTLNKASLIGGPIGTGITKLGVKFYDIKKAITSEKMEVDLIDLKLAAFLIKSVMNSMVTALILGAATIMFVLLFIEKLFAFISSMFLLIYAFAKNQEERIGAAFSKIIAIFAKTILIVVCVILAMFSLFLINYLELTVLNDYFSSVDTIENASWSYLFESFSFSNFFALIGVFFQKYLIYGVIKMIFMVVKMVMMVQVMWKMPGYMYELIYEKTHSVSDSVGESLQSFNERQTMRV